MDEIRPTPIHDSALLQSINATLDEIPLDSVAIVLQVPQDRVLKGAVYVGLENGWSFMTWVDKDLKVKKGLGGGVALRKKLGR